jgi:Zn-dependent protease with chaperone function/RNA polymerase subunit RPABC4/transcription elongation factor Spt4
MTQTQLEQGIEAAKAGRRKMARAILAQVVKEHPDTEEGWFWLSKVVDSTKEQKFCLRRVMRINPNHEKAQATLRGLPPSPTPAVPQSKPTQQQSGACPKCGHPLRPGAKFCGNCGRSLRSGAGQQHPIPEAVAQAYAKPQPKPQASQQAAPQTAPRVAPQSAPQATTASPPTLDYRYPNEHQTLVITITAIVIALLLFSTVSLGAFFVLTAMLVGLNYLVIRVKAEGTMRSALHVSERQRPDIYALVNECRRYVDIPSDTRVFIIQSPILNAYAFGLGKPYSIVLHSALIKNLDRDELKSVIGHEMGHIKFGHTNILSLIGVLGGQTFGIPLVGMLIRYAFLFWERTTEFTADRAGLVACGHLDKAVSTELKLGVGPELAEEVDMRELAQTWRAEKGNILGTFGEMQSTHPMMLTRIQKMIEFGTSEAYRHVRPDAATEFKGAADWTEAPPAQQQIAALSAEQACESCHNRIQSHWKVCPYCGHQLQ